MRLLKLDADFSVCKLSSIGTVDLNQPYGFLSVTDEEISYVCPTAIVPQNTTAREDGWRAFKIEGALDFGMIGVIANIAGLLAAHKISVFVISTYNTDYVLVKSANFQSASHILSTQYEMV